MTSIEMQLNLFQIVILDRRTEFQFIMSEFSVITNDFVNVFISSNITSFTSEKKFDKSLTIADLKSKLELITGGNSGNMRITAFTKEDKLICELSDPHALLGSFPLDANLDLWQLRVAALGFLKEFSHFWHKRSGNIFSP